MIVSECASRDSVAATRQSNKAPIPMQSIGMGKCYFYGQVKSASVLFRISAVAAIIMMFIFVMMTLITAVLSRIASLFTLFSAFFTCALFAIITPGIQNSLQRRAITGLCRRNCTGTPYYRWYQQFFHSIKTRVSLSLTTYDTARLSMIQKQLSAQYPVFGRETHRHFASIYAAILLIQRSCSSQMATAILHGPPLGGFFITPSGVLHYARQRILHDERKRVDKGGIMWKRCFFDS